MKEPWRVVLGPHELPEFRNRKGAEPKRQLPAKNQYFTVSSWGDYPRIVSRQEIRKKLEKAIRDAAWSDGGELPTFDTPVELNLVQYAPRRHANGPAKGLPMLDSDACLAAVRDALQHIGVVADDALILRNVCESRYRKGEPGLEIEIRPL